VCCLDLHVGVVNAPVGNRRAKINADNSGFSVLSGTTLPRVQTHNRRDRFREEGLSVPLKDAVSRIGGYRQMGRGEKGIRARISLGSSG
jgi:hypothetical protein